MTVERRGEFLYFKFWFWFLTGNTQAIFEYYRNGGKSHVGILHLGKFDTPEVFRFLENQLSLTSDESLRLSVLESMSDILQRRFKKGVVQSEAGGTVVTDWEWSESMYQTALTLMSSSRDEDVRGAAMRILEEAMISEETLKRDIPGTKDPVIKNHLHF